MKKFALEDDECERSELDMMGGEISNTGKAYVIGTNLSNSASDPKGNLHVPAELKGSLSSGGSVIKAGFSRTDNAARIDFPDDVALTNDYGGLCCKKDMARVKPLI